MALFKQKKVGAKKGYDLLKKKSDALKKAFRDIMVKILETKKRMGKDYNESLLALAEANFAAGDFSKAVFDSVGSKTSVRLNVTSDNVAGVHLPIFTLRGDGAGEAGDSSMLGLTGGILISIEKVNPFTIKRPQFISWQLIVRSNKIS